MHACENCGSQYSHPLAAALCCDPGYDPTSGRE
jgi:hypothetical protein